MDLPIRARTLLECSRYAAMVARSAGWCGVTRGLEVGMSRNTDGKQYFVGIGAHRAGTTWLSQYLGQHPQVAFSPIKELHYFDTVSAEGAEQAVRPRALARLERLGKRRDHASGGRRIAMTDWLSGRAENRDDDSYRDFFDLICDGSQRVFGEITPSYSVLGAAAFGRILHCYPDAKFIFILRNPADRHWSHLRAAETRRLEPFDAAVHLRPSLSESLFTRRTDYPRTLETLFRVVPPERVCVVFFEHLTSPATSATELAKITSFLGIDFMAPSPEDKVNASKSIQLGQAVRDEVVAHYAPIYEYVEAHYDGLPGSWRADCEQLRRKGLVSAGRRIFAGS